MPIRLATLGAVLLGVALLARAQPPDIQLPGRSPTTSVAILTALAAACTALATFLGPIIKDYWADRKDARIEVRRMAYLIRGTEAYVAYARMAYSRHPDLPEPPTLHPDATAGLDEPEPAS